MTSINLFDFFDYDEENLLEFLLIQEETQFEIIIPKYLLVRPDDHDLFYMEYYTAAYAGHLLTAVTLRLAYHVPDPNNDTEFIFNIEIEKSDGLAEVLAVLLNAYFDDDDRMMEFHEEAVDFFETSQNYFADRERSLAPNCVGLLDIANRLSK